MWKAVRRFWLVMSQNQEQLTATTMPDGAENSSEVGEEKTASRMKQIGEKDRRDGEGDDTHEGVALAKPASEESNVQKTVPSITASPIQVDKIEVDGDEIPDLELMRVAEALIFASENPVSPQKIGEIYASVSGEAIPDENIILTVIDRLNEHFERTGRSIRIQHWAGGYKMATDASVAPYLREYFQRTSTNKLSRTLLETLAIIAYRQPVTKPEVDFIRGVDSDYGIRRLLEYGLVDVIGRSESLGRPLIYGTTKTFLEQFGINDLEALPTLSEIEELLDDPAFKKEKASLLELDHKTVHEQEEPGTGIMDESIDSDNGQSIQEGDKA